MVKKTDPQKSAVGGFFFFLRLLYYYYRFLWVMLLVLQSPMNKLYMEHDAEPDRQLRHDGGR